MRILLAFILLGVSCLLLAIGISYLMYEKHLPIWAVIPLSLGIGYAVACAIYNMLGEDDDSQDRTGPM